MTQIDNKVDDDIIKKRYDTGVFIDSILEYYKKLIDEAVKNGYIKREKAQIKSSIIQNQEGFKILFNQNAMGVTKKDFKQQIREINSKSHPLWIYSPFYIINHNYSFVSNSQESNEFFIARIQKEYIDIVNTKESKSNKYGTDIIIKTKGSKDIVKIGRKLRKKLENLSQVSKRKYVMESDTNKNIKRWGF